MVASYAIGVHLAMHDSVSAALGTIIGHMAGLQRHINTAQLGFNRLGVAIAGVGASLAGSGLLSGMGALVKHGQELVNQQQTLRAAGLTQVEIAHSTARAWAVTRQVAGTTVADNLKAIGELRTVFGHLEEAEQFLPHFQRLAVTLGAVTGRDPGNAAYQAARFMELTGGVFRPGTRDVDPAAMQRNMERMTQVVVATHGRVGPQELLNFAQQAGQYARGMSPEALYGTLPTVIQAMGGHRAGTAVTAMGQMVTGGILPQRIVADLQRFGLIDMSKVTKTRTGVRVGPGGIRGSERFMADPFGWFTEVFMPALEKGGVRTQKEFLEWIGRLFGRQTAQRLGAEFYQGLQQIMRDKHLIAQALTGGAGWEEIQKRPDIAFKALHASLENLLTALGAPAVPVAAKAALTLARGINALAGVAERHPDLAKTLTLMTAGLGAGLVAIGGLAVAIAAIGAVGTLPALGILGFLTALPAAIYGLTRVPWETVGTALATWGRTLWQTLIVGPVTWLREQIAGFDFRGIWAEIVRPIAEFRDWLLQQREALLAAVTAWNPRIGAALSELVSMMDRVVAAIVDFVTGLPGRIIHGIMRGTEGTGTGQGFSPEDQAARRHFWRDRGLMAPGGDEASPVRPQSFVPPAQGGGDVVVPVSINLDGQRIAEVVTRHQGRMANSPPQAPDRSDMRRSPWFGPGVVSA